MTTTPLAISPLSVKDAVVAALRERILTGELAPLTALPEEEIAAAYGVGRPTARAAIQQLVFEGLLRRERNRSAYVPELSANDVDDLFRARSALEVSAALRLAERGVVPLVLEQALGRLEACGADAPWTDVVDAALAFHRGLIEALESPRLLRLYRSLEAELRLCFAQLKRRHGGLPPERVCEHRRILEAISRGDGERAKRLLQAHLEGGVRMLTLDEPAKGSVGD